MAYLLLHIVVLSMTSLKVAVIGQYNELMLTLKVLVPTIDAQWEGMGDVGSARYELHYFPHARP